MVHTKKVRSKRRGKTKKVGGGLENVLGIAAASGYNKDVLRVGIGLSRESRSNQLTRNMYTIKTLPGKLIRAIEAFDLDAVRQILKHRMLDKNKTAYLDHTYYRLPWLRPTTHRVQTIDLLLKAGVPISSNFLKKFWNPIYDYEDYDWYHTHILLQEYLLRRNPNLRKATLQHQAELLAFAQERFEIAQERNTGDRTSQMTLEVAEQNRDALRHFLASYNPQTGTFDLGTQTILNVYNLNQPRFDRFIASNNNIDIENETFHGLANNNTNNNTG
jgi:hypothetical protein